MSTVIDSGFGGNMDKMVGETATTNEKQLAFGEFRARSILAGNSGAIITSMHVTPRTGLTTPGSGFPAAGMFDMFVLISGVPLDKTQNNFQQALRDVLNSCERVAYSLPRSTLLSTDIVPAEGIIVPPNKYAHVIVTTPLDAAGAGISTFFNLSVTGRQLASTDLPYTLR